MGTITELSSHDEVKVNGLAPTTGVAPMRTITELSSQCSAWAERVARLARAAGDQDLAQTLLAEVNRAFADPRLQFVVCGEWNSGKSTLINALVRQPGLLPTGIEPTTSYVTLVERGPEASYAARRSGAWHPLDREGFAALTAAGERDPELECLRVTVPGGWVRDEAIVVDTPGLEDLSQARADVTLGYLPRADVIVLTVDVIQGVKASQRRFVREYLTAREVGIVLVVLTQADRLNSPDDLGKRLAFCRDSLRAELPDAPWVAVSAWQAEMALHADPDADLAATGISALLAEVNKVALRERGTLLAGRFARHVRRGLGDILVRIEAEDAGLRLTLAEAERRVASFRSEVAEAAAANEAAFAETRARIRVDVDRALRDVPGELEEIISRIIADVNGLEDLDALRQFINTDALGRAVAAELRRVCHRVADDVAAAIEAACSTTLAERIRVAVPLAEGILVAPPIQTPFGWPTWLIKVIEVILLDVVTPGGPIIAILARLGLDKLLRGRSFLRYIVPAEIIKDRLVAAVAAAVRDLPGRTEGALREAASEAVGNALGAIQEALDRRVRAHEAGLEQARARLAENQATVAPRRAELAGLRAALAVESGNLQDVVAAAAASAGQDSQGE